MQDLSSALGPDGALANRIPGYQLRPSQLAMAQAIVEAMAAGEHLVAEAGTGTGKTFAYLIPAILSGKKTVVSTGTKTLQEQLFEKDFPLIRDALGVAVDAAILKGRANYLCLYRMQQTRDGQQSMWREMDRDLEIIESWSEWTRTGDRAEVSEIAENAAIWPLVTSTADNCLGQDCPMLQSCFPLKARRKAQDVDVLIVNHHLLCADWSLKDDGFGELLPDAELIIVDEAHQLMETASQFFGMTLSARQFLLLAQDIQREQTQIAQDMPVMVELAERLEADVQAVRRAMPNGSVRGDWDALLKSPSFSDLLASLEANLARLTQVLSEVAVRSKGLESCWRRAGELGQQLAQFQDASDADWIQWFESHRHTFVFYRTPMDISQAFEAFTSHSDASWVFTSATLSVDQRFDFFTRRLGLQSARTAVWDSPYDFQQQALLYLPPNLPDPRSDRHTEAVVQAAIPVLHASQGRAFMLFTSHRALQEAADRLADCVDFPLLVQGTRPKQQLLEAFRNSGEAVLLGTASFWEGVDVRGDALSCVIIDKIPFASPGDPVMKARLAHLAEQGLNPFMDYQVPAAALMLKQGVGRLIRDAEDRGVLMLCDPRLTQKAYGRSFLRSLPNMRQTRDVRDVVRFFERLRPTTDKVAL